MKKQNGITKRIVKLATLLMLGASLNACAGLFGFGGTSWKEEVLLHDGNKIIVKRSVERGDRHELGQKPPYKEQSLSFTMPGTNQTITWEDHYSEDIGSASFLPMALDIHQGTAYLVADTMGCLSYNKWGRPNPPYVFFKYDGNEWKRIALQELPAEITLPNLIMSMPDVVVERMGKSFVTAEEIQRIISKYPQPEYRSILREARVNGGRDCGEMVSNGKGGWVGMGWFRDQPSYEACLSYCVIEKMDTQHCPCSTLFKGAK